MGHVGTRKHVTISERVSMWKWRLVLIVCLTKRAKYCRIAKAINEAIVIKIESMDYK